MGYSVQNNETGEVDYIRSDTSSFKKQEFDEETGEPLIGELKVRYVKHNRFQIPRKYLRTTLCDEFEKEMTNDYLETFQPRDMQVSPTADKKKKQFNEEYYMNSKEVKSEIILGYSKNNIQLFLIPTLFYFDVYVAFILGVLELFLHFWSHKKNDLNMNKQVYYRSPLHILTSQFCATCRSESGIEIQILELLNKQMRNARRSRTLKDVTKAIG